MKTIGMLCGFLYVGQLDTWKWMWTEKSVVIDCFLVTFEPFPFDTYMHILVHQIVWDPWRLVEGSRSTFFCQKKVLFFAKKKYFFLQIKVLFFAKKKYFFLQKKVLLCSDMITFHAVQCITRGAPKPPPRLSGPGLDVLEQQGQQDAVINKDNVIITNRSGR